MGQKANSLSLRFRQRPSTYQWQTHRMPIHMESWQIHHLMYHTLRARGLYLNRFFLRQNHTFLQVQGQVLGFAPSQTLPELKFLASCVQQYSQVPQVQISLEVVYFPKSIVSKEAIKEFQRYKRQRFFWESLQLLTGLKNGQVSALTLIWFLYSHLRRNRKRKAFLAFLKQLLNWHFADSPKIQGVRIEVKGRLQPKSRTKKQILGVGRVCLQELNIPVDYAYLPVDTIFGSLGLKVWVCPAKKC